MASPLSRAVDTAVLVTGAEKASLLLDERLMEIGYGDYEGAVFEELGGAMRAFIRDPDNAPPPPTVETIASLMERTGAFLRDLRDAEGDNILVVTHGVTIRAFLGHLSGDRSRMVWGVPVHNCQLITTTLENGEFTDAVIHEM